jgi:hypothetical protein
LQSSNKRPTGVAIIGALSIIGGIIMLILGALLILAAAVLPSLGSLDEDAARQLESQLNPVGLSAAMLGPILGTMAGIMIAIGIASIVVATGLFKGKGWAWTISIILAFIGIAIAVASLAIGNFGGIANLVINGIILYYLYRPHVKAYFGKSKPQPATSSMT